jgi:hypothetical protein
MWLINYVWPDQRDPIPKMFQILSARFLRRSLSGSLGSGPNSPVATLMRRVQELNWCLFSGMRLLSAECALIDHSWSVAPPDAKKVDETKFLFLCDQNSRTCMVNRSSSVFELPGGLNPPSCLLNPPKQDALGYPGGVSFNPPPPPLLMMLNCLCVMTMTINRQMSTPPPTYFLTIQTLVIIY